MRRGYVTVFFAAAVALIFSLFIGCFYAVRENAIRMKIECTVDTALTSSFAEYSKQLWKQYALLFVDCGYQGDGNSPVVSEEHLKNTLNENFDECDLGLLGGEDLLKLMCDSVKASGICLATDDDYLPIKAQAIKYMEFVCKYAYIEEVSQWLTTIEDIGLENFSYEEAVNAASELQTSYEMDYSGWLPEDSDDENEEPDEAGNYRLGVLKKVIKDTDSISQQVIDSSEYSSERELQKGNLTMEYDSSFTDYFLLREYFIKMCGNYVNSKDNSLLSYETEYLIIGKESDVVNLRKIVRRILTIREAADMITLMGDSNKMSTIKNLCTIITTILEVPEAEKLLEIVVVACWSNFEAKKDMKIIMSGGQVPLIKTSDEWISDLDSAISGVPGEDATYEEGMNYEDYLRVFLYTKSEEELLKHFANIVEMDVRKAEDSDFKLDNCFNAWEVTMDISSDYGYGYQVTRKKQISP